MLYSWKYAFHDYFKGVIYEDFFVKSFCTGLGKKVLTWFLLTIFWSSSLWAANNVYMKKLKNETEFCYLQFLQSFLTIPVLELTCSRSGNISAVKV